MYLNIKFYYCYSDTKIIIIALLTTIPNQIPQNTYKKFNTALTTQPRQSNNRNDDET